MCLIPAVDFTNGTLGAIYFLFLQEMAEFRSEDPNLHHYINKTLHTVTACQISYSSVQGEVAIHSKQRHFSLFHFLSYYFYVCLGGGGGGRRMGGGGEWGGGEVRCFAFEWNHTSIQQCWKRSVQLHRCTQLLQTLNNGTELRSKCGIWDVEVEERKILSLASSWNPTDIQLLNCFVLAHVLIPLCTICMDSDTDLASSVSGWGR